MHAWLLRDDKMRSRFVDEARIAGSIDSDHVVEVVSAGIDPELGVPWIAMELLRGLTLADHVERFGPMSRADCLEVLLQARHGLQMAHARNLVHRDIKPENIFVADARRLGVPFTIKVLDFGIAKWVHDARERDQNSQVIGTPSWMAPEQLSNVALIAPATDVWALGLLAFWLLTGREYWIAANDERSTVSAVLVELVSGVRVPASERAAQLGVTSAFPAGFDDWFARAVDLDSSRRYVDAASCVDALAPLLASRRDAEGGFGASHAGVAPQDRVFDTRDLESALDDVFTPTSQRRADWSAHAATASFAATPGMASHTTSGSRGVMPRTARRLHSAEIVGDLFAGPDAARQFLPLAGLLTTGLSAGLIRDGSVGAANTSRSFPDRVQEVVRHVCLVLGVHPAAGLVPASGDGDSFAIASMVPPVLGVPMRLREPMSTELLRARAAVAVVRTSSPFALLALVESPEALESARKAAVALARGAVSSSPYFRRMVGQLGPMRAELGPACQLADSVPAELFWSSAVLTIARLALLCSADRDAAVAAIEAAHLGVAPDVVSAHVDAFIASPTYETYWHRRGQ